MNDSTDGFANVTQLPITLGSAKVAIWGLGLMGGSLAMALKGKTQSLYGIDPDAKVG